MRILFLTHRLPYAPNRGDRVRAYHLLRLLRQHHEVDLLSLLHDNEEASHVSDVQTMASSVHAVRVPRRRNLVAAMLRLPGRRPTTHSLLDAPDLDAVLRKAVKAHPPDVVLAYCSGMARLALQPPLDRIPYVLDMVDVDSAKWAALAETAAPPRSWVYGREARLLGAFEGEATTRARATMVVNSRERDALRALAPRATIEVVGNGVDVEHLAPPDGPSEDPVVVFCGVMNYEPNVEGARWLATDVWPIVRKARPDAQLRIVGADPADAVRALSSTDQGIEVTGSVPDVRPYLWNAAVAAAPLLTARGIQNKVLEAIAAGLPVVVTPVVREGLPDEVAAACDVGATAAGFANHLVTQLSTGGAARRARAAAADLSSLGWARRLAPALALIEAAGHSSRSRS